MLVFTLGVKLHKQGSVGCVCVDGVMSMTFNSQYLFSLDQRFFVHLDNILLFGYLAYLKIGFGMEEYMSVIPNVTF